MKTNSETLRMDSLSKGSIWFNRVILLFVSVLFTIIGFKNIVHPAENALLTGITLNTAQALSVARASMGAFPLGFAILVFSSLFSTGQMFRGILTVFIMVATITVVRIIGFAVDGAAPFIAPEVAVTVLSGVGLWLELRRLELARNKIK
jgi:hypothetical protein